jgi:hypothetical protein
VRVRDEKVQLNCQQAQRYQPRGTPSPSKGEGRGEGEQRYLIININQTEDAQNDIERLHGIIDVLEHYPGQDGVWFNVVGEDRATKLEMPEVTINYCSELVSELSNILGEDNLRLEE